MKLPSRLKFGFFTYGPGPGPSPLTAEQEETESYGDENDELLQNQDVKSLLADIQRITGRTISTVEAQEIHSWLTDLGTKPEVIRQAYSYCVNRGKSNVKYISRVVMQWTEQGFQTKEDVQKYMCVGSADMPMEILDLL